MAGGNISQENRKHEHPNSGMATLALRSLYAAGGIVSSLDRENQIFCVNCRLNLNLCIEQTCFPTCCTCKKASQQNLSHLCSAGTEVGVTRVGYVVECGRQQGEFTTVLSLPGVR